MSAPIKRWGNVFTEAQRQQLLQDELQAVQEILDSPARSDILPGKRIVLGAYQVDVLSDDLDYMDGLYLTRDGLVRIKRSYGFLRLCNRKDEVTPLNDPAQIAWALEWFQVGLCDISKVAKQLS